MNETTIRRGRRADSASFLKLLLALAKFEHLEPPSVDGQRRIIADIFEKKRLNLFVASERGKVVGYPVLLQLLLLLHEAHPVPRGLIRP